MTQKPILALAMLAAVAITACSDDNNDVTAPGTTAQLRVVHASPDAPNVDVLVDNASVLTNVAYKAASDYLPVPSGSRNLKVRAAGTTTVVIDQDATLTQSTYYTVLATGRVASIAPVVLTDDQTNPASGNVRLRLVFTPPTCYANCDGSTIVPVLNVNDFTCFLNRYAAGQSYANCDASTIAPVLNVNDFVCFNNRFAAGCP